MSGSGDGNAVPMDRYRFRVAFAGIVGMSAVVRVVYVVAAKAGEAVVGDQIYYSAQAVTIADGRWFADPFVPGRFAADHPPLTSLALAPVSWSGRDPFLAQRLLMAGYGVLVVAGIGLLARWLFGRRVALAAAAIAAVYANLWMNDGLLMSETLAAGSVVALLGSVYVYDLRRTLGAAACIGVVLGFATLARAELLLLGPLVVVPLTLGRRDSPWPQRWRDLAMVAGLTLVVLAPWVARNQARFADPTFVSTQDGLTLIGSYCPTSFEGPGIGFWTLACTELVDVPPGADQSEQATRYREYAIDYLGDHLDRLPTVVAARLGRGLSVWRTGQMTEFNAGEGRERWASTIGLWQYWLLVPMAAWGWWRWPSRQPRWPALVTAGSSVLVIAAFYGIPRFRVPAEVVIVLGAAIAAEQLVARVGARRRLRTEGA